MGQRAGEDQVEDVTTIVKEVPGHSDWSVHLPVALGVLLTTSMILLVVIISILLRMTRSKQLAAASPQTITSADHQRGTWRGTTCPTGTCTSPRSRCTRSQAWPARSPPPPSRLPRWQRTTACPWCQTPARRCTASQQPVPGWTRPPPPPSPTSPQCRQTSPASKKAALTRHHQRRDFQHGV